jgi:hypothetical protein
MSDSRHACRAPSAHHAHPPPFDSLSREPANSSRPTRRGLPLLQLRADRLRPGAHRQFPHLRRQRRLRRLLELEFGADKVKHVRNLTDVDDRTIGQTQKEKRPLAEITQNWTDKFHADCAR